MDSEQNRTHSKIDKMFDFVRLPNPIERLVFDWVRFIFGSILFDWIRRADLSEILRKFFAEVKTEKGQALTPSTLTGIRAAIHRHLTCAPLSRNINILQDSEFVSANKMFEAKAKLYTKENNAKPKHKSSIQSGDMQKLNR